ncbi:MAG: type III pantothenate kinase [Faecousia sp.]
MVLTIDIGNSNIVLGGVENGSIQFQARMVTDSIKTSDQYCAELKTMLELFHVKPEEVEGSIVGSVVPPVLNSFRTAIRKLTGKNCLVVGPGIKTGLNIQIDNPGQTGADLVVGAVAALRGYQPPLILIDMGTATTISVLNQEGALIGGCVCPGVKISLDALTSKAALLPAISLDRPKRAIGRNTIDCMRSGIMLGTASMLDGLIGRMEEELGTKTTVVITGGLSKFIAPLCKTKMIYDEDLILKGLWALYQENRK